jgi:hypothetical protein
MAVAVAREEEAPSDTTCPAGFAALKPEDDKDKDFTEEWEFTHLAEAALKYNLSSAPAGGGAKPGCNAYVSTKMVAACINRATQQYQGWAVTTAECTDSGKATTTPIYVEATFLGRESCPWPEFQEGSPGFNENFTFTAGTAPADAATPAPAPQAGTGLPAALACLASAGVEVTTAADLDALKAASLVWNKLNTTSAAAVAQPSSVEQVAAAVKCLAAAGVAAVPRSGGHSYEGYSVLRDAVTIDLRALNSVAVAADGATAVVGGGARLGELYYEVSAKTGGAKGAVGGTCPPVGVGGLILGAQHQTSATARFCCCCSA